jgi:hypothetical protein
MAILYYHHQVAQSAVIDAFFPFATPGKISGMIIGNDLDALLSASLLKTLYGWDIVGIYDYTTLWCACERSDFTKELLDGKYLAVDLDIYHPAIPRLVIMFWSLKIVKIFRVSAFR